MAKHHESHGSRGTRRSTVEPRVAYSRHAETHSAHGSQLHYGQHASHRSAAAIAAQRTRRIAVLVVAAVVASGLGNHRRCRCAWVVRPAVCAIHATAASDHRA